MPEETSSHANKIDRIAGPIGTVLGLLIAVGVMWKTFNEISPYLTHWMIWALAFFIAKLISLNLRLPPFYSNIFRWLQLSLLVAIAPILLTFQMIYWNESEIRSEHLELFEKKLARFRWITYEPVEMNPYPPTSYGTIDKIKMELQLLRSAGFNGVITFSSKGLLAKIPEIAKEVGFKGVITGIIDPNDEQELNAAIASNVYTDGYCVGHMFADYPYSQSEVISAIEKVKRKTPIPVTTTLRPNGYLVYPKVAENIDWFFPDVHSNWYNDASAETALKDTRLFVNQVNNLQDNFPDKPVLLKMVSLPSSGAPKASPFEQFKYFRKVVELAESSMDFPDRVYVSYFSGFDIPWKTPEKGWPLGEQAVGLFSANREVKEFKNEENAEIHTVVDAFKWSRIAIVDDRGEKRHNKANSADAKDRAAD